MGILSGLFGKSKKESLSHGQQRSTSQKLSSFTYRVYDVFSLKDSQDLVLIGQLDGEIHQGGAIYLTNYGEDNSPITLTIASDLEVNQKPVSSAKDTIVAIRVENAKDLDIRPAMIGFSRDISSDMIHQTYVSAIGDIYVSQKEFNLSDDDLNQLSLTDGAEVWRLANWLFSQKNQSEKAAEEHQKALNRLGACLVEKLFDSSEIFAVINQKTGEPHLFSQTVARDDGYECLPPDIGLVTAPYRKRIEVQLDEKQFKLKKIENGPDKEGIRQFLQEVIFVNGACGVTINSDKVAINASMLVEEPDYSNLPDIQAPIRNPDVMRWLLLLGQLEYEKANADHQLIEGLYQQFLFNALSKAKLLLPMNGNLQMREQDRQGKGILEKDSTISFPITKGKEGRSAVYMFTDWKQLRKDYDDKWSGLVESIDGMIETFDILLNVSKETPNQGIHISQELWQKVSSNHGNQS